MTKLIKHKFKIIGMHCNSCAMNIDFDLEELDGIESVRTSYARQESEVVFDEVKISESKICECIKNAGYEIVKVF